MSDDQLGEMLEEVAAELLRRGMGREAIVILANTTGQKQTRVTMGVAGVDPVSPARAIRLLKWAIKDARTAAQ